MTVTPHSPTKPTKPARPDKPSAPGKPASDPRRGLGATGEALAVQALQAAGLTVVERNWRCAAGEIDIVAQETGPDYVRGLTSVPWLVIVEVRTRRGQAFGTALQSVAQRKQAKLREVAKAYVEHAQWAGPWRIDVVAVQMDGRGKLLAVEHIRHAVRDE
jgi:putative endonuclease